MAELNDDLGIGAATVYKTLYGLSLRLSEQGLMPD
jgi:hypothetical protein